MPITRTTRTGIVLLVLAQALAGCSSSSPSSPSRLPALQPGAGTATPTPPISVPPIPTPTLTSSASTVAPGGPLSVNWNMTLPGAGDWIGLYQVGEDNAYHGWYASTLGAASGTFDLTAPVSPGRYEFRYLRGDKDLGKSSEVTVR